VLWQNHREISSVRSKFFN